MSSQVLLEQLVVRLIAEAGDYKRTLDDALAHTNSVAKQLQKEANAAIKAQASALNEVTKVTATATAPIEKVTTALLTSAL